MIAEIGHFALILALLVAAVQASVPLVGAWRGDRAWMAVDRVAASTQFCLVTISFGALVWLHVTSDFSVLNVVDNSHTDKPLIYKITGVWGNHEGSMMLWTFILVLYGLAVSIFGRNLPPGLRARALAIQGLIAFAFILKGKVQQHRQWMTRSFAVALVFLEVRVVGGVTGWDNLGVAATETIVWSCVAFSVLAADIVLQWQELRRMQPALPKRQTASP